MDDTYYRTMLLPRVSVTVRSNARRPAVIRRRCNLFPSVRYRSRHRTGAKRIQMGFAANCIPAAATAAELSPERMTKLRNTLLKVSYVIPLTLTHLRDDVRGRGLTNRRHSDFRLTNTRRKAPCSDNRPSCKSPRKLYRTTYVRKTININASQK